MKAEFPGFSAARRVLVLGGARSGKSRFAEALAEADERSLLYIATGAGGDAEMAERIAHHRNRRGQRWTTIEEPVDLAGALSAACSPERVVLVDCLTLWLTNLILAENEDADARETAFLDALAHASGPVVLVSNEVGLGIVPDNALARDFRDRAGRLNQWTADICDAVYFIAAGLPLALKTPLEESEAP